MKLLMLLFIPFSFFLFLNTTYSAGVHCPLSFTQSSLCAKIEWANPPAVHSPQGSSFLLSFFHPSDGPQGPYLDPNHHLKIDLWMPQMNHGSAPVKITPKAAGVFQVSNVHFIMPGYWQIRFKLSRNAGVIDQVFYDLHL